MKARFDATFAEQLDVNMRAWRASAAARSLRRRDIAVFFVVFTLAAFAAGSEGSSAIPWSKVHSVKDLSGDVEVLFGEAGMLMVRERAFTSHEERAAFIARARELAARP